MIAEKRYSRNLFRLAYKDTRLVGKERDRLQVPLVQTYIEQVLDEEE